MGASCSDHELLGSRRGSQAPPTTISNQARRPVYRSAAVRRIEKKAKKKCSKNKYKVTIASIIIYINKYEVVQYHISIQQYTARAL